MDQQQLEKVFGQINKILQESNATLSDVRIISVQLQDMVENYKLENAIRDLQTFLIESKTITEEQIKEYIQNKKPKDNPQNEK